MARRRLIIRQKLALGDTVVMTALVRDIQTTYPGQFDILVDTHVREVWEHNPHCRILRGEPPKDGLPLTRITITYKEGILAAGRGNHVHMLAWYHRDFAAKTGLTLEPTQPKGDLHLTQAERSPLIDGRYWLVIAGGKDDVTVKMWWPSRWQQTVDAMARLGLKVVQSGANFRGHTHPKLTGVIDLVGKYPSARQLFNLIANAEGVVCPVTAAMHIAAVFDKPCVVLAGGREEPWWEGYVNSYQAFGPRCPPVPVEHCFLHTIGLLDCCSKKGCWRHRTAPIGRADQYEGQLCKLPVLAHGEKAPRCQDLITVDHAVEAIMSYYETGKLPPIGEPKRTYAEITSPAIPVPSIPEGAIVENSEPVLRAANENHRKVIASPGRLVRIPGLGDTITDSPPPPDRQEKINIFSGSGGATTLRPSNIDHPILGGRLTVFVLCYGPHAELARSCITSITQSLPADCLDLRIGLNAVCDETRRFVKDSGLPVTHVYDSIENIKKYPLMRRMFHDPRLPIQTPYVVWFDDDARVVDPLVWSSLCDTIVANHPLGSQLYGNVFVHDTKQYARGSHNPLNWFRGGKWWNHRNLRVRGRGMEAPNGSVIEFVSGWFWALSAEMIRAACIPCPRLNHNGGDITIGEQVHQLSGKIKQFNKDKRFVFCPPKEAGGRRGYSEKFPWAH